MTVTAWHFFWRTGYAIHLQFWEKYGKVDKAVFTGSQNFILVNSFWPCERYQRKIGVTGGVFHTADPDNVSSDMPYSLFLVFYKWAPKRACSSSHLVSVAILGYVWESQHAPFQDNPPLIGNSSCFSAVAPPTHGLRFFLCHFIMDAMDDTTARLQVAPGGTRCWEET